MNTEPSTSYHLNNEHPDIASTQAFGFWIYLMSDLILFSTLFATFVVFSQSFASGPRGSEIFNLPYVGIETLLLLFSSFTYGLSMLAMHNAKKKLVLIGLTVTFVLGLGFVLMEINEFYRLIIEGHTPGISAFLSSYFTLVGTHGIHVTFGLIWMAFMLVLLFKKGLTSSVQSRLTLLSMFWHFLDIIWIGIFSVVYLKGVM